MRVCIFGTIDSWLDTTTSQDQAVKASSGAFVAVVLPESEHPAVHGEAGDGVVDVLRRDVDRDAGSAGRRHEIGDRADALRSEQQ